MHVIAFDIGERRTGVAWADASIGIPLPLETLHHNDITQLTDQVHLLLDTHSITHIVFGLPKLPDGSLGKQAHFVENTVAQLGLPEGITYEFIDERYTSSVDVTVDKDASAACSLLQVYIDKEKS